MYLSQLIEDIRELDHEAANYIDNEVSLGNIENSIKMSDGCLHIDNLSSLMVWNDTPQGHKYWHELYRKLNKTDKIG